MAGSGRHSADEVLALKLAAGWPVRRAAKAAGLGERTAGRRLADAAFRHRVSELRSEMVTRASGRLSAAMTLAVIKLRKLLGSADENVVHKTATSIIGHGVKVTELIELQRRVEELERRNGATP